MDRPRARRIKLPGRVDPGYASLLRAWWKWHWTKGPAVSHFPPLRSRANRSTFQE